MILTRTIPTLCGLLSLCTGFSPGADILISPETELKPVLKQVGPGDSIVLSDGIWTDPELRFEGLIGTEEQPISIRAESPGKVVLSGKVKFGVSGKHVVVSGFRFLNAVEVPDVFEFRTHSERHAHQCRITDCSFEQTKTGGDQRSIWLNVYGSGNRVDHCYFSGKQNPGTTLVVWVDETPGEHRIDHNHFGHRPELGENGGETVRIGTSEVSELNSRTIVEENYFERCNGEAEIVSNKSCENIYRYNLFDRCEGALTLRHGHRCVVEGNVFLGHEVNRTGGVRLIGSDHRVINNYFEGLRGDSERSAISLMNGVPDGPLNGFAPVRNAIIAHNTLIDCKVSMEFGVSPGKKGTVAPSDCVVSHNAFIPGKWELFRVPHKPVNFTWAGNQYQSGKTRGADLVEIERVNMEMVRGADGLLRPTDVEALLSGSDSKVEADIDGKPRRPGIAGCDDPGNAITIRELPKTTGPTWRG
ncbi:MAG: polysaccharide lyase 6 family protein [Verrucomicrobiaceae bacterium]